MAIIAAAGEFAAHLGITGWEAHQATWAVENCLNSWINLRGGTERQEVNQIIRQARGFIERHGDARFIEMVWSGNRWAVDTNRKVQNRAGYKRIKDGKTEFLVMPTVFRDEICSGMNQVSAVKVLVEQKLLIPGNDGKSTSAHRIPDGGTMKLYHLSGAILSGE